MRAGLPAHVADAFDGLPSRPAIRLGAAEPGDPVVGQLGGEAALPVGHEWPLLPGGEPLLFVARLDCAALHAHETDVELPGSGSLLFFLPMLEEMDAIVDGRFRPPVIHVPEGTATADQRVPSRLRHPSEEYDHPLVPLSARTILSVPGKQHPALGDDAATIVDLSRLLWYEEYDGRSLAEIVRRYRGFTPDHQIGGYSDSFQTQLEIIAATEARWVAGRSGSYEDPAFLAEARQWVLLLQLDEDTGARMLWGDGGLAMWAIRREDLAARNFDATYFTTQSH